MYILEIEKRVDFKPCQIIVVKLLSNLGGQTESNPVIRPNE